MRPAPHVLVNGVVLSQPMGGVRRHNAQLLPRAARLLEAAGGALSVLEGAGGLPFELPPEVRRIVSAVPAAPALRRALQERRAIERALALEGLRPVDLVHTAHFPVPRLPLPFSLTVHDLRTLELEHTPLSRRLIGRSILGGALRRARVVIAVSETVRTLLLERWPLDPTRVLVVPNAADHFVPLPRLPLSDAPILHVGHLERRKNLELLLEALALDASLPRLVLAGAAKHGEDDRLRRRAEELGVGARVFFTGPFDDADLPALYAGAACVVLPSLLEGFGIPAIEALRAGVPLACARAGALREVVGTDAVPTFDPRDAADCARALQRALAQQQAPAPPDFTWDESARRLVAAWRTAVEG